MNPKEATPRQKRTVLWRNRTHPDIVAKMLTEFGKDVDDLMSHQASAIISACEKAENEGEGDDNREQNEQERRQEEQDEQQEDQGQDHQGRRRRGWRAGSKQAYIAKALHENGLDVERTMEALKEKIGKIDELTFKSNSDNSRQPLPLGDITDDSQALTQFGRARKTIQAVRRQIENHGQKGGGEQKQQEHKQEQKQEDEGQKKNRQAMDLLAFIRQARKFCIDRAADGHPLDEIGLRWSEYGAALLANGVPAPAIKHALTMHFPPEARTALSVTSYDVKTFKTDQRHDGMHAALPYCLSVVGARDFDGFRVPLTLVGPKGTGKTTLAKHIAKVLAEQEGKDVPFGFVSMTSGTSPSAFNGRPRVADDGTIAMLTAIGIQAQSEEDHEDAQKHAQAAVRLAQQAMKRGDTIISQFVRIYRDGGVFLFDEMDAADPNLLLGVNAAIANNVFANPATGELIEQSPDFIAVAGMNTLGLGSGRDYVGRSRLDAATLDRWNPGRVQITLDERIEESLFWHIVNR